MTSDLSCRCVVFALNTHSGHSKTPKAGEPALISVNITRRHNRIITYISGIEIFRLDPDDLGQELEMACASSQLYNLIRESRSQTQVIAECPIAGGIGEAVRIHQGDYRILRYLVLIQTRV